MEAENPDPRDARNAPLAVVRRHLASAPEAYLEAVVDNPVLTRDEMLILLRNRRAPVSLLERVARDPAWNRHREVKRGLVQHPNTPLIVARGLVPHLFWRDLAETAADVRINPIVRRTAEKYLEMRMDEMTLGERVTLARGASRAIVRCLLASSDGRVLRGLLSNPRLVEQNAARIASSPQAPPDVLAYLGGHPKWGCRRAVRIALTGNPRTPVASALRVLGSLDRRDLQRISRDAKVPTIVRIGAERRLDSLRRAPDSAGAPRSGPV